jgi:hypothetical protein
MNKQRTTTNIDHLIELLPEKYEEACYEQKAIIRARNIKSAKDLMRLSLIYLSNKCSLVETSQLSSLMGFGKISDVGFMKRFSKCGNWFKWILEKIKPEKIIEYQKPKSLENYEPIAVDASDIVEKGSTKRIWRLHYAINIFKMTSQQYKITDEKTGESLKNFDINPGQLIFGDRAYGTKTGIEHCLSRGGDFVFRIKNKAFKLYDKNKIEINLASKLSEITEFKANDIDIYMENSQKTLIPLRICAIKKTPEQIKKVMQSIQKTESRKQTKFSEETKETHKYIFVITSLPKDVKASEILDLYRLRWQIELSFKRLKSIMNFGDLPRKHENSVIAWLNGKLIVALLLEKLLSKVYFSPSSESSKRPKYLA